MSRKQLVTLFILMLLPLLLMLLFFAFLANQVQANNEMILNAVDKRISTIVLATLDKIREDVGILSPPSSSSSSSNNLNEGTEIKIDGDTSLSTFGDSFYINNRRYEKGDFISPYGITIFVGKDLVVFDDLKGGLTFFGQAIEKTTVSSNTSGKEVTPPSLPSGV